MVAPAWWIKYSWTTSQVSCGKKLNISQIISTSNIRGMIIISMMMEVEMVPEMLGICPQLAQLVACEDFIEFSSFKSFANMVAKHQKCDT
jgi:hypothetical protein